MIVYSDLISGDQMLSDSRPQKPLLFEGEAIPNVVTVQAKLMAKGPVEVNTGANASKEEQEEGMPDTPSCTRLITRSNRPGGLGSQGGGPQGP
jgi:hypothetical protein